MTAMYRPDSLQAVHMLAGGTPETYELIPDLEDGPSAGEVLGWIFNPIGSAIAGISKQAGGPAGQAIGTIFDPIGTAVNAATKQAGGAPTKGVAQPAVAIGSVPVLPEFQGPPGMPPATGVSLGVSPVGRTQLPQGPVSWQTVGGAINQGIDQLVNGIPAPSGLGSLFGAGFGAPIYGTGNVPGALGAQFEAQFGRPQLPPGMVRTQSGLLAATPYAGDANWNALANHSEQVGRAVVRRVLGVTEPALNDVKKALAERQMQVQATAEHNILTDDMAFKKAVISHLVKLGQEKFGPAYGGSLTGSSSKPRIKTY